MAMLSGGALLDGPALARLNEMGLHDYTGFAVRDRVEKDTVERLTDDPLNGAFAGWHRDCRPSFWPETSWVIEPALPGARVLAEVQDFTPRSLGAVAGCVENALGGRVAVLGYYPWRFVQVLAKTAQLKALCRWLSRDTLPAYVRSFHRVALWCRQDHQGRSALMLLNASLDAAERVQVCLRGVEAVSLIRPGQRTRRLRPDSEDGPYAVFTLPRLEPWDFATALPAT
jgi:hypothetical protein